MITAGMSFFVITLLSSYEKERRRRNNADNIYLWSGLIQKLFVHDSCWYVIFCNSTTQ